MTPEQNAVRMIEGELAAAAAHLKAVDRTRALADGSGRAAEIVVAASVLAIALRLTGFDTAAWVCLGSGVLAAAAFVASGWVHVNRRTYDWANVAQRLDGGNDLHNRIATAYEFAATGQGGPFTSQIIEQGLSAIRSATVDRMVVEPHRWPITRWAAAGASLVVVLAVARFASPPAHDGFAVNAVDAAVESRSTSAARPATTPPVPTPHPQTLPDQQAGPSAKAGAAQKAVAQPTGVPTKQTRSSPPNDAASMPGTQSAAGGSGSARMNAAHSAAPAAPTPESKLAESARESRAKTAAADAGAAGVASPPGGSGGKSGDDSTAAAKSDDNATSPSAAAAGAKEDAASASSADDHASPPPQGSGAPLRQDRGGQASRELGQSGNTGDSGNGRGGPSAAKKARGTSAIFLSVPLPDVVPGQLAAGPSRMSSQQIPPRPGDVTAPPAVVPNAATGAESAVDRFTVPRESSAAVQNYLKRLRAEPPSPPEGVPPS